MLGYILSFINIYIKRPLPPPPSHSSPHLHLYMYIYIYIYCRTPPTIYKYILSSPQYIYILWGIYVGHLLNMLCLTTVT